MNYEQKPSTISLPGATSAGMSLLEVMIAIAIFATFLVAVIQSMIGMGGVATFSQHQDDLESESRRILVTVTDDLSNSAWFFRPDVNTATGAVDWVPVYPRVTKSVDPLASYGDTLEFVKLRTERTIAASPESLRTEYVNFSDTTNKPIAMAEYWNGPAVRSLVLNEDFGKAAAFADETYPYRNTFVAAVWESNLAGLTFLENANEEKIRRYRYLVRTNPVTGSGTLVRQFKNAGEADYLTEQVVAEYVYSLKVDSSVTWSTLNRNQIHVSLTLERPGQNGVARARRTVEATVAMRSITNAVTN